VALCTCGGALEESADADALLKGMEGQGALAGIYKIPRVCTQEGWDELQEKAKEAGSNRLLIAACMPYVYAPKLKELSKTIGMNPRLMDVVDIRTDLFSGNNGDKEKTGREIASVINMAVSRLKGVDPGPLPMTRVEQKALVVGGGIAGMTAALSVADHGFDVTLVEKSEGLGGNLRYLHRTIEGGSPQGLLEETIAKVEKHPKIQVYTNAQVLYARGRVGRFSTTIEKEDGVGETLRHGVVVLATGGQEAKTESYGYGQSEAVVTQHELEGKLAEGAVDPKGLSAVAMIQCVDSREEPRNYCSRVCCTSALKNALYLKEQNPDVDIYIYYRDLMTYGFLETYYTQARKAGIIFVHYEPDGKPRVEVEGGKPRITALDPILERELTVEPDLLVLSTGIVPNEVGDLAGMFGVERNQDGFFQEAEYKWRPVDFMKEGIFTAGIAQSPRSVAESIAMGEAAAQRALRILTSDRLAAGKIVAQVRTALCSLCEKCIDACPYGARMRDEEEDKIIVDELMCQGCGSCAAVCPNSASVLRGYKDQNMFDVIDAALEAIY
jgi:heterodisulfide reductase subunit A